VIVDIVLAYKRAAKSKSGKKRKKRVQIAKEAKIGWGFALNLCAATRMEALFVNNFE
jgi:hypothetical protein